MRLECDKHKIKSCKTCIFVKSAQKRRIKNKQILIQLFGGKCQSCNYNIYIGALDFHHVDPKTKSFNISQNCASKSFKIIFQEAMKCVVLCANCHREIEAGLKERPKQLIPICPPELFEKRKRKIYYCSKCFKKISRTSLYCRKCRPQGKVELPSIEKLKILKNTKTIREIAIEFLTSERKIRQMLRKSDSNLNEDQHTL